MPHKESSLLPLDLFEYTPTPSKAASAPAPAGAAPAGLTGLSDAQLVQQLDELMGELQRRMETDSRAQPGLERAVSDALERLERVGLRGPKSERRPRPKAGSFPLQAVRAALLAGVAPGQVAKHFGLSLAAVRQVLAEAA
jgi:hypothetical protein